MTDSGRFRATPASVFFVFARGLLITQGWEGFLPWHVCVAAFHGTFLVWVSVVT